MSLSKTATTTPPKAPHHAGIRCEKTEKLISHCIFFQNQSISKNALAGLDLFPTIVRSPSPTRSAEQLHWHLMGSRQSILHLSKTSWKITM
mmetsp:Transcript_14155/g.20940  ORF Transcript_14155/g.20940 Transcript_14155/m.20940 type:complete len:91 (+) Transcript_14155:148-420(+)